MESHHKHPTYKLNLTAAAARKAAILTLRGLEEFNEHGVVEDPQHVFVAGAPDRLQCTIYAHRVRRGFIASFELISLAHEVPGRAQPFPGEHSCVYATLSSAVVAAVGEAKKLAQEMGKTIDRRAEQWAEKVQQLESDARGLLIEVFRKDEALPLHGIRVWDLFSGAGGASHGFMRAGAYIAGAVEIDPEARWAYKESFRPGRLVADICDLEPKEIDAEIVFIGWPCQAFSIAGKHRGLKDPKRAAPNAAALRILREASAVKVFVIECSRQFLTRDKGVEAAIVRRQLMRAGFAVQQRVLSAECFGSPLARERAFMIATRLGTDAETLVPHLFPREATPTATVEDILEPGLPATIPEADIKLHTPEPRARQQRRVELGHIGGRDSQGYRVYSARGVGATLTASGGGRARCSGAYKVPGGARGLTPAEAHRGMGFPEWAAIHPVATHAYRHAGNAVAVPVAYAIAARLASVLRPKS